MKKKSEKIVEATKETLKRSTFHGIRNIMRHQFKLVRYMWLVIFICSAGYFFYNMSRQISAYLEYPVETKIEVHYVNKVIFPLIKICRSDLKKPEPKSESPTSDRILFISLLTYFQNLYKANGESFQKTVGIANISDIMISCLFELKHCNISEFSYYYEFSFGSCWQFNSGKDVYGKSIPFKVSTGTGLSRGLFMELYLGRADENYNFLSRLNSLMITISNEHADYLIDGGIIYNGRATHMTLEKYNIKTQPQPYGDCIDNLITEDAYPSECYKKTLKQAIRQHRLYHYSDCFYICFQKLLTERCNCYGEICDRYYPNVERKCVALADVLCFQKTYGEYLNNKTYMDLCDCPRECSKTGYYVTSTFAEYPTKYRSDFLVKNSPIIKNKFPNNTVITQTDLAKRITSVYIYFNELKEIKVTQKPKWVVFDLVAQIGSQMFIFLGSSFLFVGELLEIILQCIVILFKFNKN